MATFLDRLAAWFVPPPILDEPTRVEFFGREERSLSFEQLWGTTQASNTIAGVNVSAETAMNAPAVWACVRLISGAIAGLPLHAFRDIGDGRQEINLPEWLRRPVPTNPNVTRAVHVQQVVTSLLLDGNAFIYVLPNVGNPVGLRVLDPATVRLRTDGANTIYIVEGADRELTPEEIIHIPYQSFPGKDRGLNPIDAARETIGLTLAAQQYGSAYFGNGMSLSLGVEYPVGVEPTTQQVDDLKKDLKRQYVGARKSHGIGALTGGAKFVDLAKTNRDSQLLELREYQVEDVGRMYGVPPHMIGSQKPGAVAYASVEQRNIDFVTHGLQPVIEKLEDGYERVLRGQRTFFKFNVDGLLRGDAKSRWEAYGIALDKKVMLREEVRAKEDLPSIGELGFLETPNNNAPQEAAARAMLEDGAIRVDVHPSDVTIADGAIRSTNFLDPVTVEQTPQIEVTPPAVNVEMDPVIEAVRALGESILNQPKAPTVIATEFIRDADGHTQFIERHLSDGTVERQAVKRDGGRIALVKSA